MAYIPEEESSSRFSDRLTLQERVRNLERKEKLLERGQETEKTTKTFQWPFKWRSKFSKSKRKINSENMLVIFLNKKNEMEIPKFMPIFDGNMIVWKNKPYEFDPRAVWRLKGVKGAPQVYLIKEIDRRPVRNKFGKLVYRDAAVSNMDLDEIRRRGDSTESDEFLIKAALKAQTSQVKKNVNVAVIAIIAVIAIGALVYFLFK